MGVPLLYLERLGRGTVAQYKIARRKTVMTVREKALLGRFVRMSEISKDMLPTGGCAAGERARPPQSGRTWATRRDKHSRAFVENTQDPTPADMGRHPRRSPPNLRPPRGGGYDSDWTAQD